MFWITYKNYEIEFVLVINSLWVINVEVKYANYWQVFEISFEILNYYVGNEKTFISDCKSW